MYIIPFCQEKFSGKRHRFPLNFSHFNLSFVRFLICNSQLPLLSSQHGLLLVLLCAILYLDFKRVVISLTNWRLLYPHSESPYQAWIDGKYRYRTSDAGREYINHDDSLFVYLGSVSDINDEYYQNYRNRWDFHVDLRNITHDTVYLGETTFEGYDCFPVQERGSNCFNKPQNVYSYTNDTNLLLVSSGNDAAVYVKLQGSDSKETGMYR